MTATAQHSAWEPLRIRAFRALWMAQFASNVGTWMQVVGAQWLMGDLGGGALAVALVQTASSLPIFLLVVPAGALGDIADRRRLLIWSHSAMLVCAGLLAAGTLAGAIAPWSLLLLTFALGAGQALTVPSWQAIQPELVGRDQIPQAAVLNGVNFNVARAVGPAVGGLVIAGAGAGAVFVLNAVSFVAVIGTLVTWRRAERPRAFGAEHALSAIRAGARFVRSTPSLRIVITRTALFMTGASALWALLPVVARDSLDLGAGGYGLLLASVGVGAVAGAFVLPRLRARFGLHALVGVASLGYAGATLVAGTVRVVEVVVIALTLAGLSWIGVLSSLNASAQLLLPDWTRARGLAWYMLVFMGAQAFGALSFGALASLAGVQAALVAAAGLLVAGVALSTRFRLPSATFDLRPASDWPEPNMVLEPHPSDGPVLVTIEWRVAPAQVSDFLEAMRPLERARRRTGARRWGLFQDAAEPDVFLESFTVATWEEHLRQHEERVTVRDVEIEGRAREAARMGGAPPVRHLLAAYRRR